MQSVAVIGAGAVGLSTALNIQRVLPEAKVRIIADKFSTETTSYGAGGIFLPTMKAIPGVPRERLRKWCEDSWDFYSKLALSSKAAETGHVVSPGYIPCNGRNEEDRVYKDIVFSYREMTQSEMEKLNISGFRYCYQVTTIITTCSTYMAWLTTRFRENGGEIEHRTITNIEQLAGNYDIVVNCSGFRSKDLFNDKSVYAIRGQLARVVAPWIKAWYYPDNGSYIIVNRDNIVLGGTRQQGNENEKVDSFDSKKIIEGCLKVMPALKGFKMDHEWVGLRPGRTPLRVEKEIIKNRNGNIKIVHNYGHGANGICLSWGTAIEAAQMVKEMLSVQWSSKL